ncbi:hypothetical protein MRX96_004091 [Rhipicephalus microplus]
MVATIAADVGRRGLLRRPFIGLSVETDGITSSHTSAGNKSSLLLWIDGGRKLATHTEEAEVGHREGARCLSNGGGSHNGIDPKFPLAFLERSDAPQNFRQQRHHVTAAVRPKIQCVEAMTRKTNRKARLAENETTPMTRTSGGGINLKTRWATERNVCSECKCIGADVRRSFVQPINDAARHRT